MTLANPLGHQVVIEYVNQPWAFTERTAELSLLELPATRLVAQVVGRLEDPDAAAALVRCCGRARSAIERLLGPSRALMQIYIYTDHKLALAHLGLAPAFIHRPTRRIHMYPWTREGHEIAHFLAYEQFGDRPTWPILDESIAIFFGQPDSTLHLTVTRMMLKKNARGQDTEARINSGEVERWMRQELAKDAPIPGVASFFGYLLQTFGLEPMHKLWHRQGPIIPALEASYGRSVRDLGEQWVRFLDGDDHLLHTPLVRFYLGEEAQRAYEADSARYQGWADALEKRELGAA